MSLFYLPPIHEVFLFIHLLPRLQQLEQEVVGGEQARNKELQQRHRQRKNLADQRKVQLIRALSENSEDSENVLLNVYNSIQEEVHAKSQMLVKVQGKVCHSSCQINAIGSVGYAVYLEQISKIELAFDKKRNLCPLKTGHLVNFMPNRFWLNFINYS